MRPCPCNLYPLVTKTIDESSHEIQTYDKEEENINNLFRLDQLQIVQSTLCILYAFSTLGSAERKVWDRWQGCRVSGFQWFFLLTMTRKNERNEHGRYFRCVILSQVITVRFKGSTFLNDVERSVGDISYSPVICNEM